MKLPTKLTLKPKNVENRLVSLYINSVRMCTFQIELGQKCSVLNKFILERQVVGVETFNCKKSSFLAVLYKTQETFGFAANSFVILDVHFNIIFEMKDTRFCYTSIFRWKSLGVPDLLYLAFTEMLSERVHLIVVNVKVSTRHLYPYLYVFNI